MISLEDYDKYLKEFQAKYSHLPGVISIEDDKWDGSTFVVVADLSKFDKDSVPHTYEGADIFVVDVYGERDSMKEVVKNLMAQHPDLKEDDKALDFFHRRIHILEECIQKYEEKK